jgi:diphthamide biosynthesis protein 7
MHAGTRLVRVTCKHEDGAPTWGIEVLAKFTEHESFFVLTIDRQSKHRACDHRNCSRRTKPQKTESFPSEVLCVSSSFYDRRLCVWTVDL